MATSKRTRIRNCSLCGAGFAGHPLARYCTNACRNRVRELRRGADCAKCGTRIFRNVRSAQNPVCQPCRRASSDYAARVQSSIEQTWACGACGDISCRPATRGQKPKWCEKCRNALRDRAIKISVSGRISVYERDGWTCWLCEEAVDRKLIRSRSQWRPSLDHVTPRSKGGSDDPMNLRLAHFWCNSVRSDGRAYSPEDFRVSG